MLVPITEESSFPVGFWFQALLHLGGSTRLPGLGFPSFTVVPFSGSMGQPLAMPAYLSLTTSRANASKRPPDPRKLAGPHGEGSRTGRPMSPLAGDRRWRGGLCSNTWPFCAKAGAVPGALRWLVALTCNDSCSLFPLCFAILCYLPPLLYFPVLEFNIGTP